MERAQERAMTTALREKRDFLEQEVLQYRQNVTSLQERLDRVSKDFHMDVEDLHEVLMQIKVFRLQHENCKGLTVLVSNEKVKDPSQELAALQASHAETILELQKTRELLVMQHKLNSDLQADMKTEKKRSEREREWKMEVTEKDKLLKNRAFQINSLQSQLRELTYHPRNNNKIIPQQYTWTGVDQEVVQTMEGNTILNQLQDGGSLLEINLIGATFTPVGLRLMRQQISGTSGPHELVTFCTYTFLDFEMHSTPLVSGTQPNYGFTSYYVLTGHSPTKFEVQGVFAHVEVHQALGGVQFITQGRASIPLIQTLQHRGEKVKGKVNITGSKGDMIGVLEFWVRLFSEVEPKDIHTDMAHRMTEKMLDSMTDQLPIDKALYWSHIQPEELFEYGGGLSNELLVVLKRCVGVCWQGFHTDAYLIHRLYDLPLRYTPKVPSCTDPVFSDSTTYPLAVTADLIEYLKVSSLWVYMIDDSECQPPTTYLAKTPVPLQALITGRPIKGCYVLRDPAGIPRGIVSVHIQWRYPFQSPEALFRPTQKRKIERDGKWLKNVEDKTQASPRSIAKLRVVSEPFPSTLGTRQEIQPTQYASLSQARLSHPEPSNLLLKMHRPAGSQQPQFPAHKSTPREPVAKWIQFPIYNQTCHRRSFNNSLNMRDSDQTSASTKQMSSRHHSQEHKEKGEEESHDVILRDQMDSEVLESSESIKSSDSDVIIHQPQRHVKEGNRLKVEILSLLLDPSSSVALDQAVQQVYVEYRLLGIPMETTETPMSLQKPTEGEEIHFNFSRVIYVDSMEAAPLRQYLYTILERTDTKQGRLKFTVVSEPLNEEEECVEIGHAYLDLQELLLTGNDVIESQIDIVRIDGDQEVVGRLRVSLEAAQALTGISWEYPN